MATANLTDEISNGVTVQDVIDALCLAIQPHYQAHEVAEWLGLEETDGDRLKDVSRAVRHLSKS